MKRKLFVVFASLLAFSTVAIAQRSVTTINEAWQFQKANATEKVIVDIPHCWNALDCLDDARGYYS